MGVMMPAGDELFKPLELGDRKRLRQLTRYLAAHYPTPFPVQLLLRRIALKHDCLGVTYRRGDVLVIQIDPRVTMSHAFDLTLHEWAHAVTWPASARHETRLERFEHPDHPPEWRAVHGQIIADFSDGDAIADSREW